MRLWSLHPRLLDSKGLVALWREALLAKHVLQGKTKGYRHHPQLRRFRNSKNAIHAINQYLAEIYETAAERGYHFDRRKVNWKFNRSAIKVTRGQMRFEASHLLKKLKQRDPLKYTTVSRLKRLAPHPIFKVVSGEIEAWEIT